MDDDKIPTDKPPLPILTGDNEDGTHNGNPGLGMHVTFVQTDPATPERSGKSLIGFGILFIVIGSAFLLSQILRRLSGTIDVIMAVLLSVFGVLVLFFGGAFILAGWRSGRQTIPSVSADPAPPPSLD